MVIPKSYSSVTTKMLNAKAARPSKPIKSSLSAEFVQDSEESEGEADNKPKDNHCAKSTKNVTPSTQRLTRRRIPSQNPKNSLLSNDKAIKNNLPQSSSEDESQTASSSREATSLPVKQVPGSSRSSWGKPQNASNDATPLKRAKKVKIRTRSEGSEGSESSPSGGNESGRESDDQSESGTSTSSAEGSDSTSLQKNVPRSKSKESITQSLRPFEPPSGFEPANISTHPSSKISDVFAPSNLTGKQIWHITAPTSVPMALIKGFSTQSLQNGASITSHEGSEYSVAFEPSTEQTSNHTLLLPSAQNNDYKPSRLPINKTLRLQQIVSLPTCILEPSAPPNSITLRQQTHVKAPRQQPPGLKMRYHPFGVSEDSDSDSDMNVPAGPEAPVFRMPKPLEHGSPAEKRKYAAIDNCDHSARTSPAAKTKKQKHQHGDHPEKVGTTKEVDGDVNGNLVERTSPSRVLSKQMNGIAIAGNDPKKTKKSKKRDYNKGTSPSTQSILPHDLSKEAETVMPDEVESHGAGLNRISPDKKSIEEKAKRKEARPMRKEMELTASSRDSPLNQVEEPVRPQPGTQSAGEPSPPMRPRRGSPAKAQMKQASIENTPRKETKEERAKRKEEKRRRKAATGSR